MAASITQNTENKPEHSPIGASSMYRWAICPGSINLSKGLPNIAGRAAQVGTLAHEIAAYVLEESFGKNINDPGDESFQKVLQGMLNPLAVYWGHAFELKQKCENVHVEHRFDMSEIYPGLYGTADLVAYDSEEKVLYVSDYKHGEGIVVNVENNKQLSYYALGALSTLGYDARHVEMAVIQPRAYHPEGAVRKWRVPVGYFIDFQDELVTAAEETKKRKAALNAGSHCQFCPAKSICKEKEKSNLQDAKKQFGFYRDPKLDFDDLSKNDFDKPEFQNAENDFDKPEFQNAENDFDWLT